ncbi:MAG TPA: alanyl-tRNA editing protein [Candidatus Limivicinus faecipullorum]|nr:alanyl-tRNA editing protein [Candidatus Limivicinus faecipullorum]
MYTEKLYYKDSHCFEFTALVLDCRETARGPALILDRTAFFPEGGGQLADTGSLGAVKVLDVHEKEGEILHYCDGPLMPGERVEGRLDAEQRLVRMQNHSGEHVVSGLAHKLFGCENVGFHMGEDFVTIDFDRELSREQLMEIETLANRAVREDLPVSCTFPEPEALKSLEYRSKLELTENVRIVEIPGVDRCACCAPHVERTGEIGLIKVLDWERHRGGLRLSLACGMLALRDYRVKQENISAISQALSSKRHETAAAVERLLQEQQKSKERIAALSLELARYMAEDREETEGNICVFDSVLDEVALRELVNLLMEKCRGIAAAFSGDDRRGYRYIMGSLELDMRSLAKELNSLIEGRGGGKARMIQGSASASASAIAAVFERDFR